MTEAARQVKAEIPADQVDYLIATAARAPSILNTQPWRFKVDKSSIELYADLDRKLRVDPIGREMVISCGAALFGLRLAVRSLGFVPVVELLPDPSRLRLLARVTLGTAQAPTASETRMLEALPHRHTHRGPFDADPLPAGLLPGLQHDAQAEGATLALIDRALGYEKLADIMGAVSRRQDRDARARADVGQWSSDTSAEARDGVPAHTFVSGTSRHRGTLPQRDFDLGRGIGQLAPDGPPPAATAVLLTAGDTRADWLCAGQALHRVLVDAASRWVFASIHTRPLEAAAIRSLIRDRLSLPGAPQIILQLGMARTTQVTARRAPSDLLVRGRADSEPG
jgi:nitroreductase